MCVIHPFQFAPLPSSSSHLRLHQGVVVMLDSYCQVLIAFLGIDDRLPIALLSYVMTGAGAVLHFLMT